MLHCGRTQVGALCGFKSRLLAGCGSTLRMYELGKKKMLRKCEYKRLPHHIVSLHVSGSRIFVGDSQESVHFMKVGARTCGRAGGQAHGCTRIITSASVHVCKSLCVRVHACVCTCVRVGACMCVCLCVRVLLHGGISLCWRVVRGGTILVDGVRASALHLQNRRTPGPGRLSRCPAPAPNVPHALAPMCPMRLR